MRESFKEKLKIFWKGWGCSILIAVMIATSFKSAIADWYVVPSGSMKPTIVEGDRIFTNKLAYDLKIPFTTWHIAEWNAPQRGEIVVFYSPEDGKRLIKRIVGMPGDTVTMRNNRLAVNGKTVNYEPIDQFKGKDLLPNEEAHQYLFVENLTGTRHPVMITPRHFAIRSFGPVRVPEDHYFMMGDNRDNSADSRYFGCVERSRIVGRALSIVISLDINHQYRPRWERFFTWLL